MLVAPDFEACLSDFDLAKLDDAPGAAIGIWPDSTIAYVNEAFRTFARDNGGGPSFEKRWGLGAVYLDAIAAPMSDFFREAFAKALETHTMWEHNYRCPSPTQQQRFRMRLYPLAQRRGCLVMHSLFWVGPHEATGRDRAAKSVFLSKDGLYVQCSNCRHVRRNDRPAQWDFVHEFIVNPPANTSHGLCPTCAPIYDH